jgi:tetratricopeptide (TPR) repeat protein
MALELANRSVELEPDSWVAYFNRALVRAANDAPDDALTDYDRAIELGMPYFQVYDEAALMATFWMDDPQRGLGYVEAGLAAHPDNPFLLADLGMLNIYTGNFEDSLAPLQRAIEINPEIDLTYVTLGFANANLGNDADALAGYLDWVGIIEEERIEQEIVLSEYTTLQMVYGRVYALTFTLEDDTSVNIRTTRVSGVDPLIFVNDSNGEVIAYNDDRVLFGDDADLNSEINGLSLPAGTYTLIATHAGAGSDGLMRVIIEPAV